LSQKTTQTALGDPKRVHSAVPDPQRVAPDDQEMGTEMALHAVDMAMENGDTYPIQQLPSWV